MLTFEDVVSKGLRKPLSILRSFVCATITRELGGRGLGKRDRVGVWGLWRP